MFWLELTEAMFPNPRLGNLVNPPMYPYPSKLIINLPISTLKQPILNYQFFFSFCVLTGSTKTKTETEQLTASDGGEGDEAGEDHLYKHNNITFITKISTKTQENHCIFTETH